MELKRITTRSTGTQRIWNVSTSYQVTLSSIPSFSPLVTVFFVLFFGKSQLPNIATFRLSWKEISARILLLRNLFILPGVMFAAVKIVNRPISLHLYWVERKHLLEFYCWEISLFCREYHVRCRKKKNEKMKYSARNLSAHFIQLI